MQSNAKQRKAKQWKAMQSIAKQCQAMQSHAKQCKAMRSDALEMPSIGFLKEEKYLIGVTAFFSDEDKAS